MILARPKNINGDEVGYLDEDFNYRQILDYNKHIFHYFQNSIGKSVNILTQLKDIQEKNKRKITFKFQIVGYPNEEPFIAIITLDDFINKGKEYLKYLMETYKKEGVTITSGYIKFSGRNTDLQILTPIHFWTRHYYRQQNTLTF